MAYNMKEIWASKTNYGAYRALCSIGYITIHFTSNDGDTAENNGKYFQGENRKSSAHYFVDDTTVVHSVPDDRIAWAVGGRKYNNGGGRLYGTAKNANTLNVELCDTIKNGTVKATEATINNALNLVKELMSKYNIPVDRVIRHYDVNGKPCPSYWVDDALWEQEFHGRLTQPSIPDGLANQPTADGNWYYYKDNQVAADYTGLAQTGIIKVYFSVFDSPPAVFILGDSGIGKINSSIGYLPPAVLILSYGISPEINRTVPDWQKMIRVCGSYAMEKSTLIIPEK